MGDYREHEHDSVALDPSSPFFLDHVSRYWWAASQASGKSVLDCACGKGYGSFILSQRALSVLGVDLNRASLEAARAAFVRPNLEFREQDATRLDQLGRRFEVITAFEMIEHLPTELTDAFLSSVARALEPGGIFLVSTPNHDVVLKSGSHVPEFHINNFRASELREALRKHFGKVEMLGQFRERRGLSGLIFDWDYFNLRHALGQGLKGLFVRPGPGAPPDPVTNEKRSLTSWYERPYPGVELYRFSPRHWRQAGLTVAACRQN